MARMEGKKVCTWDVEKIDEEGIPVLTSCGNKAVVEFSEIIKMRGRLPKRIRYPRCRKHASPKTIEYARKHGYKVEPLDKDIP